MTQQPGKQMPQMSLRGAVDLAAVAAAAKAREKAANRPRSAASFVIDVTEAEFQTVVVEQSLTVPVVLDLWADWCAPCKQLGPVLEQLAEEYAGRFLLAKVDVEANPRLGQIFQAQSIPLVVAVVKGQPVPLFQGAQPEPQVRAYLEELLRVAAENGVTGTLGSAVAAEPTPELPPEPPLHAQARAQIDAGDLAGAAESFRQALLQSPADEEAKLGLAQVGLLQRTEGVDPAAARAAAAAAPEDLEAQLMAADLDLLGGHVADAFDRLIAAIRVTQGEDRQRLREHLVELFAVVGPADPRVATARRALTTALF
ncbi:MAG: tetratricopeptide repeat protein [Angustibacter sp.]